MTSKVPLSPLQLINFIRENSKFSRREIMDLLKNGKITVNDAVITDANHSISLADRVFVNKVQIEKKQRLYYKFNKPANVISTFDDPSGRKDLGFFIIKNRLPSTLRPCGRLDRPSTGLLLFSNDGDFIHRVLHPNFAIPKTYEIKLDLPLSDAHKDQLITGIFLDDGPISMTFVDTQSSTHFIVRISIGRNRILRRSFAFFGYKITTLHRLSIGPIDLGNLPSGKFEPLPLSIIKSLEHN